MYLLDTNTLIYFFRGEGGVAERILSTPPSKIALMALVYYELKTGILKSNSPQKRMSQLEDFKRSVAFLEFGEKEAEAAADIRAQLEAAGSPIGPYDILIAGTVCSNGGILVSRNVNEFKRVDFLKVENWYS